MCEKPSCDSKSKKLMNKLTDDPDAHDFIVIEWMYVYSQPNYGGAVGGGAYTYTISNTATPPPNSRIQSNTYNPNATPVPLPPQGSITIPQGAQLISVRASKIMCRRCKFIDFI